MSAPDQLLVERRFAARSSIRSLVSMALILLLLPFAALGADSERAELVTQEYRVSPGFLEWSVVPDKQPAPPSTGKGESARDWLTTGGVVFSGKPSIVYIEKTHRVIVRHTAAYQDAFRRLVEQWNKTGRNGQRPDPKILEALFEANAPYKE